LNKKEIHDGGKAAEQFGIAVDPNALENTFLSEKSSG
jgi:hypothetical protein